MRQARQLSDFLTLLLGRHCRAKRLRRRDRLPAREHTAAATYLTESDELGGVCVCDFTFATGSAAALSLLPRDMIASAMETGVMETPVEANFREVVNVLSRIFVGTDGDRVILSDVVCGAELPPHLADWTGTAACELHYAVTIEGYGTGGLSFFGAW